MELRCEEDLDYLRFGLGAEGRCGVGLLAES